MNILIVRLSALGDVIQGIPCLVALKESFPDWKISWLVEAPYAPLLEGHPCLDRLFVLENAWRKKGSIRKQEILQHHLRLFRQLRAQKFDATLDLQGLFKSALWTRLSGAPRRIGYDKTRELAHSFLNEYVDDRPTFDPTYPLFERYLAPALYLGADRTKARYLLPNASSQTRAAALALLEPSHKPRVALCPWSLWPSKNWPLNAWKNLAHRLVSDFQLLLVGSSSDRPAATHFCRLFPEMVNLTGRTPLPVLAEIFRHCQVVVGADTGPLHLANAVEKPHLVMLFGSTSRHRSGPIGKGHSALALDLPCQPCFERLCPLIHQHCLHQLDVERVEQAVRRAFSSVTETTPPPYL